MGFVVVVPWLTCCVVYELHMGQINGCTYIGLEASEQHKFNIRFLGTIYYLEACFTFVYYLEEISIHMVSVRPT